MIASNLCILLFHFLFADEPAFFCLLTLVEGVPVKKRGDWLTQQPGVGDKVRVLTKRLHRPV